MNDRLLKKLILETIQETLGESDSPDYSAEITKAHQCLNNALKMMRKAGVSKRDIHKVFSVIQKIDSLGLDSETSETDYEDEYKSAYREPDFDTD